MRLIAFLFHLRYKPFAECRLADVLISLAQKATSRSSPPSSRTARRLLRLPRTACVPLFSLAANSRSDARPLPHLQLAVTQSISGTGALRIGTAFFARHYPGAKAIYLPTPTWGNHMSVLSLGARSRSRTKLT